MIKPFYRLLWLVPSLLACTTITRLLWPEPPAATLLPRDTATAASLSPTPRTTPAPQPLTLNRIESLPDDCNESPFGLPAERIIEVAYVPSGYCFNGEIDLFEIGGRVYVVQSLAFDAAFFITEVTDPANPAVIGAWQWSHLTYTADVKAFQQGDRHYISLSLEPETGPGSLCGVAIVEVTDPPVPSLVGLYNGDNTAATESWCDVHTTEIGRDDNGDGAFVYVSAIDTADLRLLDIRNLDEVREVNHYSHPERGYTLSGENFVHDTTPIGDRVYVAYWSAGAIILDRALFESGGTVAPLNPPNSIAPEGLQVHHAFPTADGNFLFVEDEVNYDGQVSQLRLFDIHRASAPAEVVAVALDAPFSSPHNLLVDGNLLFVGWYSDGVRVFEYDVSNPEQPSVVPYAFKAVRPGKTIGVFGSDIYDGIYGMRLRDCRLGGKAMRCIYASDLTRGLLILAMEK